MGLLRTDWLSVTHCQAARGRKEGWVAPHGGCVSNRGLNTIWLCQAEEKEDNPFSTAYGGK